MKKSIFFIRLFVFWLVYFALFRLGFVLFYKSLLPAGELRDTLWAFAEGLRMDAAAACYFMIPAFVLYTLFYYYRKKQLFKLFAVYQYALIALLTLLHLLNIYLYRHWGEIISARIFIYAPFIKDDLSFISNTDLFYLLASWLVLSGLFCLLSHYTVNRFFRHPASPGQDIRKANAGTVAYGLLVPSLIIIGMRGGVQFTPINESKVYYSAYPINNVIATNVAWFMGFSMLDESNTKNPYVVMPDKKAKAIVHAMLSTTSDSTMEVLNTQRPNIIIIMLESWTADVVKELGGDTASTPCFDTLRRHGFLFTHAYAGGERTDQGLAAIVSGFPSQPDHSIVNYPDKAAKLPFITDAFIKMGYSTSYYHGGDADFANMKIFLVHAGFSRIVDRRCFSSGMSNGRLGINDQYVFARQLQDMNKEQQPFFSLIMTLSSHEPFEVPTHHKFSGRNDIYDKFRNAIYYSDHSLAVYLANASHQPWFKNTLFILCSDHANFLPRRSSPYTPEGHHIVLMFYGGALKNEYRGKEFDKTTDQVDIAAMLYSQLHLNHSQFPWSKDDLNPGVKHFAYFADDEGAGIVSGKQHLVFFFQPARISDFFIGKIPADSLYDCSRAWLQEYYQQYLNY